MRTSLGLLLAAGTIAVVVLKQREVPVAESPAAKRAVAPAAAAPDAAPAEQASQHWPKRALDRASDVKRQVAEQRSADGTR